MIALSVVGSATLLFSCSNNDKVALPDYETLMTEASQNRTITMMENGQRSYSFFTPMMEGYSMASNPYQEFRRGIVLTTYTSDSLSLQDATITSNYAIYYERQKLWEAKGNVVIIKNNRSEGDTTVTGHTEIYTQQLFWNAKTKKIYSNVDTKVLQPDGWHFGVGFDADDDLKNIHFRKYRSEMEFDMSRPSESDSTKLNDTKAKSSEKGGKDKDKDKDKDKNKDKGKEKQQKQDRSPNMEPKKKPIVTQRSDSHGNTVPPSLGGNKDSKEALSPSVSSPWGAPHGESLMNKSINNQTLNDARLNSANKMSAER